MSMFNDIPWGSTDHEKECESNARLVTLFFRKDSEQDTGHFSVLVEKSGLLSVKIVHKLNGTEWQGR